MKSRLAKGVRWFWMTMLFVVWLPVFKAFYAFSYPDSGKKLAEALALLIGTVLFFGLPAFVLGFATGRKADSDSSGDSHGDQASQDAGPEATHERAIYAEIADELESDRTDIALWTKLFAQHHGDENRTKAAYIEQRAKELIAVKREQLLKKSVSRLSRVSPIPSVRKSSTTGSWRLGLYWLGIVVVASGAAAVTYMRMPERTLEAVDRALENVEAISIEASDLNPDANDTGTLVLAATIRNRAGYPQEYPSLELTLTDARDSPIVRRVLRPDEYLGRSRPAKFAAESVTTLSLRFKASSVGATGYRLYAFFPSGEPERLNSQINPNAVDLFAKGDDGKPSAPRGVNKGANTTGNAPIAAPAAPAAPPADSFDQADKQTKPKKGGFVEFTGKLDDQPAATSSRIPSQHELRPVDLTDTKDAAQ